MSPQTPVKRWIDLAPAGLPVEVLSGRHDRPIPVHAHDFWELQLGERGLARHVTADGETPFRRGSIVLMRPGTWHRKDSCHGLVSWACCWPGSLLQEALVHVVADVHFSPLLHHRGSAWTTTLGEADTRTCLDHLAAIRGASPARRMALVVLILDLLATSAVHRQGPLIPAGVLRVLDAFDAYPERPWTVTGAARLAGLGVTHFSRCCRAVTGRSPLGHLTHRRLERASALLLSGGISISDVANRCGFRDPDYFSRCFRRHRGCTPREWPIRIGRAGNPGADTPR